MACARPDSCGLGLRRYHGITDRAETSRLPTAGDPKRQSEEIRWSVAGVCRPRRRNAIVWLDSAVMMIFQSTAVTEILLGRDAGWQVQRRDDGQLPRKEVIRKYALP